MPATQPISLTNEGATSKPDSDVARADLSLVIKSEPSPAIRRHLPDERRALTHHFSIAGQEGLSNGRDLRGRVTRRDLHHHGENRARPFPG